MNLKAFFACFVLLFMGNSFAMEESCQYCSLCRTMIIDCSRAVIVYENGKACLAHGYCYDKYVTGFGCEVDEASNTYCDSDVEDYAEGVPPRRSQRAQKVYSAQGASCVSDSPCCEMLDVIFQFIKQLFEPFNK